MTMLLSTAEIASMRATQALAWPDTCTISRATVASDGMGGQTETWSTVATVACRLGVSGTRPNEGETGDQLRTSADFVFTMEQGTDVRNGDRIGFGSRTFEVTKAQAHSWETALRVVVVEVT